jgi:glycine amidinotransferase/scyllo-inosamine-4-phosphate amidinotransferase 1
MRIHSLNEFDPLRTVVVGSVDGYSPILEFPPGMPDSTMEAAQAIARSAFPSSFLEEVAEDLADFVGTLERLGVKVLRPSWCEASDRFSTPNWSGAGFDLYNVRDLHLVVRDRLIAAPSATRGRFFEHYALRKAILENFEVRDFRWIHAPPPCLRGDYLHDVDRPLTPLELEENVRHRKLGSGRIGRFRLLDESEILFDAANVIRLGRDLLYLVSCSGNRLGGEWLQAVLGDEHTVHFTSTYRSSHLDSTILPLREGLVLLNGARVDESSCPEVLAGWDRFYFSDCAPVPESEVEFHRNVRLPAWHKLNEIGVKSSLDHITSPWIGLNLLMLGPGVAFVQDRQVALMRALERRGCEVVPVRLRHPYTMHGGLHCMTLDLERDSSGA